MKKKLSWNEHWMNEAFQNKLHSNDPRLQVGCVIVTEDNEQQLSNGYNGDERGGSNKPDSLEPGASGFIHAEINALIKMNYSDPRPRKIYITHSPCVVCARALVNGKISKVFYHEDYRDSKGLDILRKSGIEVIKLDHHWE